MKNRFGEPASWGPRLLSAATKGLLAWSLAANAVAAQQTQAIRLEPPQAGGYNLEFGNPVAMSGEWSAIGDYVANARGEVYLYRRGGMGWTHEQKFVGPMGSAFGVSIDVDGAVLVVGAFAYNQPGPYSGIASVYELRGERWVFVQRLTGPAPDAFAFLGHGVGVHRDTIVIGASGVDGPATNSGRLYVYERKTTRFDLVADARLPVLPQVLNGAYLGLGKAVAVHYDTIVAGAPGRNGAALVLEKVGGQWQRTALLADGTPLPGDGFGCSVAVEGDLIVVGEPADGVGPATRGSAFVFEKDGSGQWTLGSELRASDGFAGSARTDEFGRSVAIDEGRVVVGSNNGNYNGADTGTAYLFERDSSGSWVEAERFVSSAPAGLSLNLGTSVDMEDGFLLAGASATPIAGSTLRGAVYVFERVLSTEACPGQVNSSGSVGQLVAVGDEDGLTLSVSGLPSGAPYVFFLGQPPVSPLARPCLRPPYQRLATGVASPSGTAMHPLDPDQFLPGSTLLAQLWYDDSLLGPNFTGAASIPIH